MTNGELVQALRVDLTCEIESIMVYEAHAMSTTDESVRRVLFEIVDEERKHLGEIQELIYKLSPRDAMFIEQGRHKIKQSVKKLEDTNKLYT